MSETKTPEWRMQDLRLQILKEVRKWEDINENGCGDPCNPDGTNMNLARNHITYAKTQIMEICTTCKIPVPEEMYIPTPPAVDDYYMANTEDEVRTRRFGRRITTKKTRYEKYQLKFI